MFPILTFLLILLIAAVVTACFLTSYMISEENYASYLIAVNVILYLTIISIVAYFILLVFITASTIQSIKNILRKLIDPDMADRITTNLSKPEKYSQLAELITR